MSSLSSVLSASPSEKRIIHHYADSARIILTRLKYKRLTFVHEGGNGKCSSFVRQICYFAATWMFKRHFRGLTTSSRETRRAVYSFGPRMNLSRTLNVEAISEFYL